MHACAARPSGTPCPVASLRQLTLGKPKTVDEALVNTRVGLHAQEGANALDITVLRVGVLIGPWLADSASGGRPSYARCGRV
jgi:hypothetical protein